MHSQKSMQNFAYNKNQGHFYAFLFFMNEKYAKLCKF